MRAHRGSSLIPLVITAVSCLAATGSARATPITNGDFSTGQPAPAGWVFTPGFVTTSNSPQSHATLTEDVVGGLEVDLSQIFAVTGGTSLSFQLTNATPGTSPSPLPAFFQASLIDPVSQNSLVPVVGGSTGFYTHDLDSVGETHAALGVTVTPSLGSIPATITVDISSLSNPTDAKILFSVIQGDDTTAASVSLTNVQINGQGGGGPPGAPEPASGLLLLGLGLPLLARYAWVRRRTRQVI
jgi:hypothetical protein